LAHAQNRVRYTHSKREKSRSGNTMYISNKIRAQARRTYKHTRENARDTTIILEILIGKRNVIINRDGRFQRAYKRDLFVPEYVLQKPRGVTT